MGERTVDALPNKREAYLNVRLPAEMYEELEQVAKDNDCTVSHVVRSALRQWLAGDVGE